MFYPQIDPQKIAVTYLASSIGTYDSMKVALPFKKFLVFVGNRDGYKNFMPMLEAMLISFQNHESIGLICVGGGAFKENEQAFLQKENLSERIIQKNLSDSELKWIYSNAVALIFPSEYEGFGIPVIEAFECGCPVILPHLSSFPEIGGDAGLFYEKSQLNRINFYVDQLLSNDEYKKDVIEKCIRQAANFSWEKMTIETLQVYKSITSV
ncbi:MAG: glycosyltransferase [Crocinitomicaceae bacterium]|nr:glycosyltransferase [Crocinitomicaceae bacterium]